MRGNAELRQLKRVHTRVIIHSRTNQTRLDSTTDTNDPRLARQHQVKDSLGRIQTHHAHTGIAGTQTSQDPCSGVSFRAGYQACGSARVLVVCPIGANDRAGNILVAHDSNV